MYVRDRGILHQLSGIESLKSLLTHPKTGASWEGFVLEQILTTQTYDEVFLWATHQGAEIDLILRRKDELIGVECKRSDAPKMTPSIRIAIEDLGLKRVAILYPGTKRYPLADTVAAIPLQDICANQPLFE